MRFAGVYSAVARPISSSVARQVLAAGGFSPPVPPQLHSSVLADARALHQLLLRVFDQWHAHSARTASSTPSSVVISSFPHHRSRQQQTQIELDAADAINDVSLIPPGSIFLFEVANDGKDTVSADAFREPSCDVHTPKRNSSEDTGEGSDDILTALPALSPDDARQNLLAKAALCGIVPETRERFSGASDGKIWELPQRFQWQRMQSREERNIWYPPLTPRARELFDAVESDDCEEIRRLVSDPKDAAAGASLVFARQPNYGATALHVACMYDHVASARVLLELGSDVSTAAANGATPLHWAAQFGSSELARVLIDCGADIYATTNTWLTDSVFGKGNGRTPLHWAVENGNLEVVQVLLARGSLTAAQDERGVRPGEVDSSFLGVDPARAQLIESAILDTSNKRFICICVEEGEGAATGAEVFKEQNRTRSFKT